MLRKHWSDVPIAEDVKELANDPERLVPDCDILTAGYPCQPFSVAGKQRGAEDDRHIWPEIRTIVEAKRPTWCVFENVYGHIKLGLDEVLSDLKPLATPQGRLLFQLAPSMLPTNETESGLLHTPTATGNQDAPSMRDKGSWWATPNTMDHLPQRSEESTKKMQEGHGREESVPQSERTGGRGNDSNVADTDSDDGRHRSGTKSQKRKARVEHGRGGKRQSVGKPDENVADTDTARTRARTRTTKR